MFADGGYVVATCHVITYNTCYCLWRPMLLMCSANNAAAAILLHVIFYSVIVVFVVVAVYVVLMPLVVDMCVDKVVADVTKSA